MCLLCGYSEQDTHGLSSHTQQILKPEKKAVTLQSITDIQKIKCCGREELEVYILNSGGSQQRSFYNQLRRKEGTRYFKSRIKNNTRNGEWGSKVYLVQVPERPQRQKKSKSDRKMKSEASVTAEVHKPWSTRFYFDLVENYQGTCNKTYNFRIQPVNWEQVFIIMKVILNEKNGCLWKFSL